jgi:hypothetical protein
MSMWCQTIAPATRIVWPLRQNELGTLDAVRAHPVKIGTHARHALRAVVASARSRLSLSERHSLRSRLLLVPTSQRGRQEAIDFRLRERELLAFRQGLRGLLVRSA